MPAEFNKGGADIAHPSKRKVGDSEFYFATDAELANPEWVSKFQLNNPGVKLVQNRPVKVSK